jgi:hypothetical protein
MGGDDSYGAGIAEIKLRDIRDALATEIDECRRVGWEATRDGEPGAIPVSWLANHTGRLLLLEQGVARLEGRSGCGTTPAGR